MKNIIILLYVFLIFVSGITLHAQSKNTLPFAINGWQFHEYNVPKLEEAIRHAPEYGVNFLIFSHGFFRSVEGFLASDDDADPANPPAYVKELHTPEYFRIIPGWKSDLKRIGDLATEKGIPYYLWIHEFDDIPKRFIKNNRADMDDPGLFPYLEQRYERLLKAVPGTAGFVLSLHECDFKVFRNEDVITKDDVPERIRRISQFFHDFLKKHNKQFILRNFFYEPLEMEYFQKAAEKLPDDIILMCKDMTHEFHPFYPFDPLHGQVGKKRQIIEIDLAVEKAWSSKGAYAQTDFIRRVIHRAQEKNVTGLVGRCQLFWDHPFEDSHEINLYAFSRFIAKPNLTVEQVLNEWVGKRYPAGAVPYIVSALKRTEFINHHGRWHLEYWFTKSIGVEWADYPYYFSRLFVRSRYKWSNNPADKELEEKLHHMDEATFQKLVAEKDEVVNQVRASLADIRQARRYCTAEQIAPLQEDFNFLLDAALLQREWVCAYFAMRMYMGKPSSAYKMIMEDALTKLEAQERTPGILYGLNIDTGRRYNIDGFVLEMRWRVANRLRALEEDELIIEKSRKEVDAKTR